MKSETKKMILTTLIRKIIKVKDIGSLIICSIYNEVFAIILKKAFKLLFNIDHFEHNLMELDPFVWNNSKELLRKIEAISESFNFSLQSASPFIIIFIKNFDTISKDIQLYIKKCIDSKGSNIRFFFFCNDIERVDDCIISRSIILHSFLHKYSLFFVDEMEKTINNENNDRNKFRNLLPRKNSRLSIGIYVFQKLFNQKFLFTIKKNFIQKKKCFPNEIMSFFFKICSNYMFINFVLSYSNFLFKKKDQKICKQIHQFILFKRSTKKEFDKIFYIS